MAVVYGSCLFDDPWVWIGGEQHAWLGGTHAKWLPPGWAGLWDGRSNLMATGSVVKLGQSTASASAAVSATALATLYSGALSGTIASALASGNVIKFGATVYQATGLAVATARTTLFSQAVLTETCDTAAIGNRITQAASNCASTSQVMCAARLLVKASGVVACQSLLQTTGTFRQYAAVMCHAASNVPNTSTVVIVPGYGAINGLTTVLGWFPVADARHTHIVPPDVFPRTVASESRLVNVAAEHRKHCIA